MKSVKNKIVQGTVRGDRIKVASTAALTRLPTPPRDLEPAVKKLYKKIGKMLLEKEVLHSTDIQQLVNLARWQHIYNEAMDDVMNFGTTQTYDSGAKSISAEFTVLKTAQDMIFKFSKVFGLSPYDRDKIQSFHAEPDTPADPYAALLTPRPN